MRVGPVEDMRLELAVIFDDFEPTDLGPGGENSNLALVSLKKFGAMASGLAGIGLTGEVRPYHNESGLKRWDYAVRLEGRANRFTFAITDFWGWDDGAYPEVVWQYGRRADPDTGAPVDSIGGLVCKYRDANGNPTADPKLSVGPDGIGGNADDAIPTVGNCLLWENPDSSGAQQFLRGSDLIALSHPANQTLFHTICTLTFDPDNGLCALDLINSPAFFKPVSSILAGGFFASLAVDGLRWLRTTAAPFDGEVPPEEIENTMFAQIPGTDLSNLSSDQKALLGCGPVFTSPCGAQDVNVFTNSIQGVDDPSISNLLEGRTADTIGGGLDLMNADADFLTQEFSTRKALSADGFVEPLPWEADPNWLAQGVLIYQVANQNELDPRCPEDPNDPVACFNDPTDATNPLNVFRAGFGESCIQNFGDTARFLSGDRAAAFDTGCTDFETVSANFERYWIALEILGHDHVPDPPESLEELWKMLDGDPNNDAGGDPLAGPDGIFVANLATGLGNGALADANAPPRFETRERDAHVVRLEAPVQFPHGLVRLEDWTDPNDPEPLAVQDPNRLAEASRRFMQEYDPTTCSEERCHLIIAEDRQLTRVEFNEVIATGEPKELVTVFPVALQVLALEVDDACVILGSGFSHINYLELYYQDPVAAMSLLDEGFVDENVPPGCEGFGSFVPLEIDGSKLRVSPSGLRDNFLQEPGQPATFCQDLDRNGLCDFDQDDDGVYDGADDYTPGPVSDDRILCGSGLPGDLLQDAIQFEFARPSDELAFDTTFPDGLPPRSPVFCGGPQELLGMTGEIGPGQRAFTWHGAERPDDPDTDGWPELIDICPFFPNSAQEDHGAIASDPPDGIGDACQCGDVNDDGIVNNLDVLTFRNSLADPVQMSLPLAGERKCTVIGEARDCDVLDVTVIRRTVEGPKLAPGIAPVCQAAVSQ
jgi:hypothetical protein